jgi:hypothetical protein
MSDESVELEVHTIRGHRRGDGRLDSVSVTVEVTEAGTTSRTRVHYAVRDGRAVLDHFVVDDDLSEFAVSDLQCVPVAERAVTVVPGVEEVEPAEETLRRGLARGESDE